MDVVLLARLQFSFTILFHYLFPPLSIGLATLMVVMEAWYLRTGKPVYRAMTQFWSQIFAINFGLGVATGLVMEFQFGTNWAVYSRFVGDIFGSALAAEGIFAFFLESGFLAIVIFGWEKVSARLHLFATMMVAFGAIFSAFWITVANSWQQTPVAYHLVRHAGQIRAELTDYWAMIFNPSSMDRFSHVIVGSWILGAFFVMSICAFYLLQKKHLEFAKRGFIIAMIFAAVITPLQLFIGSHQAKTVTVYQPAKLAAFEGIYQTRSEVPMWAFGIPDDKSQSVRYGLPIPGMLSWLAKDNIHATLQGLESFNPDVRPPTFLPFESYHLMITIGLYCIFISWLGIFCWWQKKLFENRWLLWIFVLSVIGPYLANELGWIATETGRQPWLVYGLLRTSEGISPAVDSPSLIASLVIFSLLYLALFAVFIYSLNKKIQKGPQC